MYSTEIPSNTATIREINSEFRPSFSELVSGRAEFNKSCNLLGSWSRRNFFIPGGILRVELAVIAHLPELIPVSVGLGLGSILVYHRSLVRFPQQLAGTHPFTCILLGGKSGERNCKELSFLPKNTESPARPRP